MKKDNPLSVTSDDLTKHFGEDFKPDEARNDYEAYQKAHPSNPRPTINKNMLRVGNFTSSEIVRLTGYGKRDMTEAELAARPKKGTGSKTTTIADASILDATALEYIAECNMERRLGRSLTDEITARPTSWGSLCEGFVFDLLSTEYKLSSEETIKHPTIEYWVGSPDGNKFDLGKTVFDIKCPATLKSFCQLVQPLYDGLDGMEAMNAIRANHKDGDKYYWQIVSNAILTDSKWGELIVYAPYQRELDKIRDLVTSFDNQNKSVAWIAFSSDDQLPFLIEGNYYKNLNIIRFNISENDKQFLTERMIAAGKLLNKFF